MERQIEKQKLIEISEETAILVCAKAKLDDVYHMVEKAWNAQGGELAQDNKEPLCFDIFVETWNRMNDFIITSAKLNIVNHLDNFNYIL